MMDIVTLQSLIDQGNYLINNQYVVSYRRYVDFNGYSRWKQLSLMFLQEHFPNHPQTLLFQERSSPEENSVSRCTGLVSILEAFLAIQPSPNKRLDYRGTLECIFLRFHTVARQLRRRHSSRESLIINDEYDVQDLLHALLKLFFDDVRAEEWCPSYAGGSKRMDFLLKDEEIAIETKMTRDGLKDKEIGEQLIIDITNYKAHPNCKQLYCFVYDPNGIIHNPVGLENDLTVSESGLEVFVYVLPK